VGSATIQPRPVLPCDPAGAGRSDDAGRNYTAAATAREATAGGEDVLAGPCPRTQKLPGATIRVLEGPGPLPGSGRGVEAESPTMSRSKVEEFVERRIRTLGERWASEVRDRARETAPALGLEAQAEELCVMISVQMSTTRSAQSSTELAIRTASCRCAASTASPANGYRVNTA
jgi:hypothetical protein